MKKSNYAHIGRRGIRGGIALAAVLTAVCASAQMQDQPATTTPNAGASENTSHRAKEFIKDAAQGNAAEIALSNVAETKSQNPQVKQLAQMLMTDHQQANQQLQTIAQSHGVTIDPSLDMMNKHEVNRLEKADATDFDKEYTTLMLKDHVKAIKDFQEAAGKLDEADVKQYAQSVLPKLREHLEKSEAAARAAGVEDSKINSIVKDVALNGGDLNQNSGVASTAANQNTPAAQPKTP